MQTSKQVKAQADAPPPPPGAAPGAPGGSPPAPADPSKPPSPEPNAETSRAVAAVGKDSLGRMLRREVAAVRRAASRAGFAEWVEEFYADHRSLLAAAIEPALDAFNLVSGGRVSAQNMAAQWVEESRSELIELAAAVHSSELPSAVEDLCSRWDRRIDRALRKKDANGMEHDSDGKFGSGSGGGGDSKKKGKDPSETKHEDYGPHHEELKKAFSQSLEHVAKVDPKAAKKYETDMHTVINNMSTPAVVRARENVKAIKWHKDIAGVTKSMAERCERNGRKLPADQTVGGAYNSGEKKLWLDGGYQDEDLVRAAGSGREIYAHELAHSVDMHIGGGPNDRLSNSPAWEKAFESELSKNQLNDYAASSKHEAWAEIGRLMFTNRQDIVQKHFPKCYKVWDDNALT